MVGNPITRTPGGLRLRALREDAGKTQLTVELDANLGSGYLQRVESGKVQHPEHDTLERILSALAARYTERREVLELFGYVVSVPPPDESEIRWAIDVCEGELSKAVFPAYLLDCAHRLLTWNPFLPRLFPQIERVGRRESMLRLMFDPALGITPLIANPDVFLAAQIRALRYEMRFLEHEAWHAALIETMLRLPLFAQYWERVKLAQPQPSPFAARPLTSLDLRLPDVDAALLQFRLLSEPFAQDRRFRVMYYLPADAATMQQCAAWASI